MEQKKLTYYLPQPVVLGRKSTANTLLYRNIAINYVKRNPRWIASTPTKTVSSSFISGRRERHRGARMVDFSNLDHCSRVQNHIKEPGLDLATLHNKWTCAKLLQGKCYLPQTYLIHPDGKHQIPASVMRARDINWFYKPSAGRSCRGIKISRNLAELLPLSRGQAKGIIQKEIFPMMLYQGRKCEVRVVVVKTWFNRQFRAFVHPGAYVLIAPRVYQSGNTDPQTMFTVRAVVSKQEAKKIEFVKPLLQMEWGKVAYLRLRATIADILEAHFKQQVHPNRQLLGVGGSSVAEKPQYEVFSYDFIMDDNNQPCLVEINHNVGISSWKDQPHIQKLKNWMFFDLISQIIEPMLDSESPGKGDWQCIFQWN